MRSVRGLILVSLVFVLAASAARAAVAGDARGHADRVTEGRTAEGHDPSSSRWRQSRARSALHNFERIHPFADGNGRTGKILYNWLNGTLDNPGMPPNFFGCKNP